MLPQLNGLERDRFRYIAVVSVGAVFEHKKTLDRNAQLSRHLPEILLIEDDVLRFEQARVQNVEILIFAVEKPLFHFVDAFWENEFEVVLFAFFEFDLQQLVHQTRR